MDANTSLFLSRQLDKISVQLYEQHFPEYKGRALVPITTEPAGPGAETFSYRFLKSAGTAKIINPSAGDWPEVSTGSFEHSVRIRGIGAQYRFNFQEIRGAMMANTNLRADLASAARRAIAEEENRVIMLGSPAEGLTGLLNNPFVPVLPLNYQINSTATPQQIIAMLSELADASLLAANSSQLSANRLVLSLPAYRYISSTLIDSANSSNITILQHLEQIHLDKQLKIEWAPECLSNGLGGRDLAIAYRRDGGQSVEHQLAHEFEILSPDVTSTTTTVKCHLRTAGVVFKYPLSAVQGLLPL